ncbi:uncharacterized protein [Venturia canescens]|uniref:uncharacterized protein n=1 Tax=Venturia canescens TaxID=32260 RepID=UPI001C9CFA93|nr:uncharacterized protein LOC122407963 [Venturia canescens]
MLHFAGVWPRTRSSGIYRFFTYAHALASVFMILAISKFCLEHTTNLHLFLTGLSLGLGFVTIIQKMICLAIYRDNLSELHATLAHTFAKDYNNAELQPILMSPFLTFYRPYQVMMGIAWSGMALYWGVPLVFILIQHAQGANVIKYMLPFPTSFPWPISANKLVYAGIYIFEIYASTCLTVFTVAVDSLFGYYIFQISGQLRTLSYRIRNLNSRDNHREVIIECVSRHQTLTRCQENLERIYGPIVLWLSGASAMVLCALIYQAAHLNPKKAVIVIMYIFIKAVQTLFYGWSGTALTTENDNFREAIYASDWPGSGEKTLMTNILILLIYNKPFVLKACSVTTISVDMFLAVSNTAVSYYFMLRTLEEVGDGIPMRVKAQFLHFPRIILRLDFYRLLLKMIDQAEKYEKYASSVKWMFFRGGISYGPVPFKLINYLHFIYLSITVPMLYGCILFIADNLTDIALITKFMGVFISILGSVIKMGLYNFYREDLTRMHETLESTFRVDFGDAKTREVLLSPLNFFYRVTLIMSRIFTAIPVFYSIAPLLATIIQYVHHADPIVYHLPIMTKFPWSTDSSLLVYTLHYIVESFWSLGIGFVAVSMDAGLGFYVFQMGAQLRVLSHRLESVKASDDYRALMRDCVLRRQSLNLCRDTLERVYGPIVLWFMVSSSISLCANVYQMTKRNSDSIVICVIYIVAKLVQALFYALFGNFLTSETESFRNAVYNTGWPGSGEIPFMTSVLIMLLWKPLILSACGFSTISLDMFVAIVNTAMSYFFLLQTLDEAK